MPLSAQSTVAQWLDDPVGGPLFRELLDQGGVNPVMLTPVKGLALQQLVPLSQGRLEQSVVDDLVTRAADAADAGG